MHVLFLGNSYTYVNNLPGVIRELATAAGRPIETAHVTSGGKSLEWHWFNNESLDAVDKGGWDFVVLQDHSQQAVDAPEKLQAAATRFAARIRKTGAEPLFYLTWARRHLPEMQEAITASYLRVAAILNVRITPVGPAWQAALAADPKLPLHVEDRSHPSLLGTYLTACVFYATLTGASPVGLPHTLRLLDGVQAVIEPDLAARLQAVARATVARFDPHRA
jgi:hypothetical protein